MSNILVHEETSKETRVMIPKDLLIDCLIRSISALEPKKALGDVVEYDIIALSQKLIFTDVTDIQVVMTERSSI
tara:strand:- start:159 stop:380 length:222 start_codon:yes stop_codon:yes gene_type:complete